MPHALLYDISPPVSPELKVWPGDTPLSREILSDMKAGGNITLSTLRTTVHVGAHADAPSHYSAGGASIDQRRLDYYLGPAQVIHVDVPRSARIEVRDLRPAIRAKRVLLATGTYPDPAVFNEDFAAPCAALIDFLHGRGVRLVGVDTPSIDLFDSKDLPAHKRILAHDMAILEGLTLRHVPEGIYELIALPLKLVGFDASPVRAVLRTM